MPERNDPTVNLSPRYAHINLTPSDEMVTEVEKGLNWWRTLGGRGGNEMALARAWRIRRKAALSPDVIRRMVAHMTKLEGRKVITGWNDLEPGHPSHSRVTWALMGGDPGFDWARNIVAQLDSADTEITPNQRTGEIVANALRTETLDGRSYVVAPVVALVPGVVNGMLVTEEELSRTPEAWNGRPVTLRHPRIGNTYVTANDPYIIERQQVGFLFNVRFTEGRLKGELWLAPDLCAKVGEDAVKVLNLIETGQHVEVSTGYFCDVLDVSGRYGAKPYDGVQVDLRPDHLAVLPDELGACSWADGCGTPRVNQLVTNEFQRVTNALDFSGDVMVAFYLRDQAVRYGSHVDLWPDGAEVTALQDYHVTLAYLGNVTDLPDYGTVAKIVSEFAQYQPVTFGRVSGVGRFGATDAPIEPVYLSIDSADLQRMRAELVAYLDACGIPVQSNHGFTPHITLGYVPSAAQMNLRTPAPADLAIDSVALAWGDRVTVFPLRGEAYSPVTNESSQEIETMCDCKKTDAPEVEAAPVADAPEVTANDAETEVIETPEVETEVTIEVTPSDADRLVEEFGGLDAVRAILETNFAKARAERVELIDRLAANSRCTFGADDLNRMDTEALRKIEQMLRPAADYSARPVANHRDDNNGWVPYVAPEIK